MARKKIVDGPPLVWGRDVDWGPDGSPPKVEHPPFWTVEVGKARRPRRNHGQPNRQGIA